MLATLHFPPQESIGQRSVTWVNAALSGPHNVCSVPFDIGRVLARGGNAVVLRKGHGHTYVHIQSKLFGVEMVFVGAEADGNVYSLGGAVAAVCMDGGGDWTDIDEHFFRRGKVAGRSRCG